MSLLDVVVSTSPFLLSGGDWSDGVRGWRSPDNPAAKRRRAARSLRGSASWIEAGTASSANASEASEPCGAQPARHGCRALGQTPRQEAGSQEPQKASASTPRDNALPTYDNDQLRCTNNRSSNRQHPGSPATAGSPDPGSPATAGSPGSKEQSTPTCWCNVIRRYRMLGMASRGVEADADHAKPDRTWIGHS